MITLTPLRERDDILDLANGFLVEANMEFGRACREISERAAEVLLRYPWPGNVRELRNVIRRALEITLGNKSEAARLLRTDYKTLHLKMKHYGVDARRFRESHTAR